MKLNKIITLLLLAMFIGTFAYSIFVFANPAQSIDVEFRIFRSDGYNFSTAGATKIFDPYNLSGTLVFNATVINSESADEVIFRFYNATTGLLVYNVTINDTSDLSANNTFNVTIDTSSVFSDYIYGITINATNASLSTGALEGINNSNGAGNPAFLLLVIDNTAPSVTIDSPADGSWIGSGGSFNFSATVTNDTGFTHFDVVNLSNNSYSTGQGITTTGTDFAAGVAYNITYTTNDLGDGVHVLNVTANDTAGNLNNSESVTVYVDTGNPTVVLEIAQPHDNWTWTTDTTPTLRYNFTDSWSPNASCELFVDGVGYGVNSSVLNNTQTNWTVNTSLSIGTKTWWVNCSDYVQNNASSGKDDHFYLDVVSPVVFSSPTNDTSTSSTAINGTTFTFNFTGGLIDPVGVENFTNASCELWISNSSGTMIANGVNTTSPNATSITLQNNNSLLTGIASPNGVAANWTINCTYNGTSILTNAEDDFNTLNVDNVTPSKPTLTKNAVSSSTTTLAIDIATSSDTTGCTDVDADTSISGSGASWTVTKGGLSSGTAYSFQVTCSDAASNSAQSVSSSFTTDVVSTSGGGSASSSSKTGVSEMLSLPLVKAGETTVMEIPNAALGFTEISVTVSEEVRFGKIKVEAITLTESRAFSNEVYKSLKITEWNFEKALAEDSTVAMKFKVTKAWLSENGLTAANVAMFRFVDNAWVELTTTVGEDDGTYIHFSTETPGFSYFVIGEKDGAVGTPVTGEAPAVEGEATPVTGDAPATDGTPAVEGLPSEAPTWPWIVAALAIVVIIGLVVWLKRK